MVKHCIYCKADIDQNSVVDVCQRCGIGVWGHKMFAAILENMNDARAKGDLYQGSVTDPDNSPKTEQKNNALNSIAQEALATQESSPAERQLDSIPNTQTETYSFPKADSLGPEKEIKLSPPHQQTLPPQEPPQHVEPFQPNVGLQPEKNSSDDSSDLMDALRRF